MRCIVLRCVVLDLVGMYRIVFLVLQPPRSGPFRLCVNKDSFLKRRTGCQFTYKGKAKQIKRKKKEVIRLLIQQVWHSLKKSHDTPLGRGSGPINGRSRRRCLSGGEKEATTGRRGVYVGGERGRRCYVERMIHGGGWRCWRMDG